MTTVLRSPSPDDTELATELRLDGARVIHWPETSVIEPENYSALDEAIENLFGYDWLIFKNEFAAEYFLRPFQIHHPGDELDQIRILTIGEATELKLRNLSVHVDLAVDRFDFAAVFQAIEAYVGGTSALGGLNFLAPSAGLARESFELQLEEAGARVDSVVVYRTVLDSKRLAQLNALLVGGAIDFIIFTSPSAIADFARLVDTDDLPRVLLNIGVICIDAKTKEAAIQFGLREAIVPSNPTALRLAASITKPQATSRNPS